MKEQLTVRLDPEVLQAAREKAQRENLSVSAVIAEAATRALLHAGHAEWEAGIVRGLDRLGGKLDRLDKRHTFEASVIKEMVGLFVRAYFNHTPTIPEQALRPSLLSGKERFARFMDTLAQNLGKGQSVIRQPVDAQDLPGAEPPPSPAPQGVPSEPPPPLPAEVACVQEERSTGTVSPPALPAAAPEQPLDAQLPIPASPKRRWGFFPSKT
jgi:hypothetical protein